MTVAVRFVPEKSSAETPTPGSPTFTSVATYAGHASVPHGGLINVTKLHSDDDTAASPTATGVAASEQPMTKATTARPIRCAERMRRAHVVGATIDVKVEVHRPPDVSTECSV